ncbi:hypothetical protein MIND_01386400 [Mycena indigotica]|uniref:Uncharacterized protein n=1 Tax=Mycena indigotica TaxID=2126181 RepID=A0A8H6RXQ7_9AGAR|nr:uncharacterized protein MIND_01386400 [Mycena indigotica]KAF7289249.1 hypothetical protein MIND_01386400 [Mycena indigotica]
MTPNTNYTDIYSRTLTWHFTSARGRNRSTGSFRCFTPPNLITSSMNAQLPRTGSPYSKLPTRDIPRLYGSPFISCRLLPYVFGALSVVETLHLSQTYNIKDWFGPAVRRLALRAEPLTVDEGKRLWVETSMNIGIIRHKVCGEDGEVDRKTNMAEKQMLVEWKKRRR